MNEVDQKSKLVSQDVQLEDLNRYLAAGNGRGRLNSAATVYNGEVGYFSVASISVGGVKQESILFSCVDTVHEGIRSNSDIVITEFPPHPKYFEKKD